MRACPDGAEQAPRAKKRAEDVQEDSHHKRMECVDPLEIDACRRPQETSENEQSGPSSIDREEHRQRV